MTPITAVCWLNNTSREIHPAGATAQCSGAATRQLTSSDERPERNETPCIGHAGSETRSCVNCSVPGRVFFRYQGSQGPYRRLQVLTN